MMSNFLFLKFLFTLLWMHLAVGYYWPQGSWAKVMFLQASVILLRGGLLSACWNATPQDWTRPPPEQTPWDKTPPGSRPPGPDPPGKQTPAYGLRAAGTHPTGMHSCLCYTLSVLFNRLVFGSKCQVCLISSFFILVFGLHTANNHLFWWSCIFRFPSCSFCTVCNCFLSDLFLLFFYHLRMLFSMMCWICKCAVILPGLTETVLCSMWHIFMLLLLLFLTNFDWYFAVYWYPYFDVVSNMTFFCGVEALL